MDSHTVYSGAMWGHLENMGIVSESRLIIEPDESDGSSRNGIITLGAQPWTEREMQELTHTAKNFMGDRQFMYRLSHELSHIMFTNFQHPQTKTLYNSFIDIRAAVNTKGFSWLGHHKGYRETGPLAQAKEDVTELINKYMIDPSYLRDFLGALASDDKYYKDFRKNMGLVAITQQSAENMYNIIEDCVRQRFSK